MAANEVLSERRGQALLVTFNRPDQANAVTLDMANQLFTLLKSVTTDRSVRCVMLCGAGGNFMDGLDLSQFSVDASVALEKANQLVLPYHSAIRELQTMDKPVLAAAEGLVSGPGLSLMLACDLVIASASTRFRCKFTEYALSPDGGCSYFLPRKVGLSRAVEMMMLDEEFDAARAERLRIVNRVVEDSRFHDEALAMMEKLAEGPTRVYGAIKKLSQKAFEQDMTTHLGLEHTYFGQSSRTFDFRESMKAMAGGRKPRFTGT